MLREPVTLAVLTFFLALANMATSVAAASPATGNDAVDFNQDVRPILSNNCFHCHGPDEEDRQAGMRLDVEGEADLEEVLARITSDDEYMVMPPPDSHKKLTTQQIATLKQWIEQGAPYQQHWAFVPPQSHPAPLPANADWSDHPIDRFVMKRWSEKGLGPSKLADKRTLIRRLSLDLTGLPPTPAEIQTFFNDTSETAYEDLVDRLLAKPQYGEHLARYWLDLVRFADTNGLHHDHYRDMTPYRDWTIRAFNGNLPLKDFIKYQVAGDLYPQPSIDQQIASGFNRLHLIIDRGTALPEESFNRNVVDRVSAVGTVFLGLTVECAVCHDHKYDPITQKDFYQLYAFFNNFDGEPETGYRRGTDFVRGLQEPFIELPSEEQATALKQLNEDISTLVATQKRLKKRQEAEALQVNKTEADPTAAELKAIAEKIEKRQAERKELLNSIPAAMVMKEREEPRAAHVLIRGAYDAPGEKVQRDTPAFLPPLVKENDLATRMDLAEWLVQDSHPLTARVAVNRFWQQLFGVGLVKTSEDFGAQGQVPSHPKLLDYMTMKFVQSGWDVKALIKMIVLSKTYQQSSQAAPEDFKNDPGNRMLARGSRYRLDAEVVRDQLLATSGLLNLTMYGKSVKPPQPAGLWEIVTMPSSYPRSYRQDSGEKVYRRSLYTFWKRGLPPPQMTIFDAPTRESCIARRERTNTPLQALMLMNEEQMFAAAGHYAEQLVAMEGLTDREKLSKAYELYTSHLPEAATTEQLLEGLNEFRDFYREEAKAAQAMTSAGDEAPELAAWTMVVHSLTNLDAIRNRE